MSCPQRSLGPVVLSQDHPLLRKRLLVGRSVASSSSWQSVCQHFVTWCCKHVYVWCMFDIICRICLTMLLRFSLASGEWNLIHAWGGQLLWPPTTPNLSSLVEGSPHIPAALASALRSVLAEAMHAQISLCSNHQVFVNIYSQLISVVRITCKDANRKSSFSDLFFSSCTPRRRDSMTASAYTLIKVAFGVFLGMDFCIWNLIVWA